MALSLVLATQAHAQVEVNKKVLCTTVKEIAEIISRHEEKLIWQGKDEDNGNLISLFIDVKDNSWTVIESRSDIACVLASGDEFRIRLEQMQPKPAL